MPISTSDHNCVEFKLLVSPPTNATSSIIKLRDFCKADYVSLNMKLISIDWGVVFASCINFNEYWNEFYRIITDLIATHVPFKSNRRHHSTRLPRYILYAIANKRAA